MKYYLELWSERSSSPVFLIYPEREKQKYDIKVPRTKNSTVEIMLKLASMPENNSFS